MLGLKGEMLAKCLDEWKMRRVFEEDEEANTQPSLWLEA